VLLPDELLERSRPHPRRERLPLGWRLEQGFRARSGDSTRGHETIVLSSGGYLDR